MRPSLTSRGAPVVLASLAALLTTSCGGDHPLDPGPHTPGIQLISGGNVTDTINTTLRDPLVVHVVDREGKPAAGVTVRFTGVETKWGNFPESSVFFPDDTGRVWPVAVAKTNRLGYATTGVVFGYVAGPAGVVVSVPELGWRDTVRYTITPGEPVDIVVWPADSATYAGSGYTIHGSTVDRIGNHRPEPVTFARSTGPVKIDAKTGAMVADAGATGRASVTAWWGTHGRVAMISVVPRGTLAVQSYYAGNGGPLGLVVVDLDGSNYRRIAPGDDNEQAPHGLDWSPDGSSILTAPDTRLVTVTPTGEQRTLLEMNGIIREPRWSKDGQWIYFAYNGYGSEPMGLYRVSADGKTVEQYGAPGLKRDPSPSPDGQAVAYQDFNNCYVSDPCTRIVDLATNTDRTILGRSYLVVGTRPAWSPVSDQIAVAVSPTIQVMRPDGTTERTFAGTFREVRWMDWSPDGRWIVVSGGGMPVVLLDTTTGDVLPLAFLLSHGEATWRP
ncbi:MAG TPA: hypothetical protein VF761_02615 [Gemmatimonadaceae bacterium]